MSARYITGDTRDVLATLPDNSVDLVLTSPPIEAFLALRSYLPAEHPDKHREIGSEPDPATFIDTLLALTADWRRVLAPHGSIAVELGDTYTTNAGPNSLTAWAGDPMGGKGDGHTRPYRTVSRGWPLPKCLALIPELYRVGLAYGRNPLTGAESPAGRWRVRNVVRWVRPNPPVGALGDKFRPATSDMVIACTASDRWFDLDAVRGEPARDYTGETRGQKKSTEGRASGVNGFAADCNEVTSNPAGAPPLDWWKISPSGYEGSHYATFPAELCVKPIEAMCPRRVCRACGKPSRRETTPDPVGGRATATKGGTCEERAGRATTQQATGMHFDAANNLTTGWLTCGCPDTDGIRIDGYHTGTGWRPGVVLDPFAGTGTTMVVANGHSRDSIGIDLDHRNVDLARERLGMFLEVDEPDNAA